MRRRIVTTAIVVVPIAVALVAIAWELRGAHEAAQEDVDSAKELSASTNAFGLRLLAELALSAPNTNVFISPSSLSPALSMAWTGAKGETRQAIGKVLGANLEDWNGAQSALLATMEGPGPGIQMRAANSLWIRQGFAVLPAVRTTCEQSYHAQVSSLDFASPDAPATVNAWVSDRTSGRIDRILDKCKPADVAYIVNAVWFRGEWKDQFKKELSVPGTFHLSPHGELQVTMMSQSGEYRYAEGDGFQAVRLPCGKGQMSMIVVLPAPGKSASALAAHLAPQQWLEWTTQMYERKGYVKIPRFKIEWDAVLNYPLGSLGMGPAFEQNADFSGMSSDPGIHISEVRHRTFLLVNEEGSEAAAATKVTVEKASIAIRPNNFTMVVDRPFLCAIVDERTGILHFVGVIANPTPA